MPSSAALHARAAALAARQHHLISRPELVRLGLPPARIDRWLDAGFLVRVERGVYLLPSGVHDWPTRLHAVCLATGGVASHRSAAALWDLDGCRKGPPEVTVDRGGYVRRRGVRVHQSTDLALVTPVTVDGIPTTPVARTLLDLGAVARHAVEAATLDAVSRRLTTWSALLAELVRHSRKGRRGCGPLRVVLDQHFGDQAESQLERRFLRLIHAAGLPAPAQQVPIHDEHGFVMIADAAWVELKVAVELDSVRYHATAAAFEADRIKRNRARAAGWLLLEYTNRAARSSPDPRLRGAGPSPRVPLRPLHRLLGALSLGQRTPARQERG
jgi:hypothetical protein